MWSQTVASLVLALTSIGCVAKSPETKLYEAAAADLPNQLASAKAEGLIVPPQTADFASGPGQQYVDALTLAYRSFDKPLRVLEQEPTSIPALTEAVNKCKPVFDLVERASRQSPPDFYARGGLPLPSSLPTLAGAMCAKATMLASQQDFEGAASCYACAFRMAHQASFYPGLEGLTVGNVIMVKVAKSIASNPLLASEHRHREALRRVIYEATFSPDLRKIAKGESVSSARAAQAFPITRAEALKTLLVTGSVDEISPYAPPETVLMAQISRTIQTNRSIYALLLTTAGLNASTASKLISFNKRLLKNDHTYDLAKTSWIDYAPDLMLFQTEKILLLSALDLFDIRESSSQFPPTYKAQKSDPYSGKPFVYFRTKEGFVLKSAGAAVLLGPNEPKWRDLKFEYPYRKTKYGY